MMRVAVAADDAAADLAEAIRGFLRKQTAVPVELVDVELPPSDPLDAPEIAESVALAVRDGRVDRAILLCGSGVGMTIAATRCPASGRPSATTSSRPSTRERATTRRSW
jgi:ribose 5-phosphate isomerase B